MAGWEVPYVNGGFDKKIIDKWSIFQPAMFDYQRVVPNMSYMVFSEYVCSCCFKHISKPEVNGLVSTQPASDLGQASPVSKSSMAAEQRLTKHSERKFTKPSPEWQPWPFFKAAPCELYTETFVTVGLKMCPDILTML